MEIIEREKIKDYTKCHGCGITATHPDNLELILLGDKQWIGSKCRKCGYEIKHLRPQPKQKMHVGDACRKCKGKIIIKASSAKGRGNKEYYYTHYLYCTNCGTIYMDNKYKVKNR